MNLLCNPVIPVAIDFLQKLLLIPAVAFRADNRIYQIHANFHYNFEHVFQS
jgi:hypothetical protein